MSSALTILATIVMLGAALVVNGAPVVAPVADRSAVAVYRFYDAVNKVNAESQSRMSAATAGMQMPPGMKLPF